MTVLVLVNYLRFLTNSGAPTAYSYQNFEINANRSYSGTVYQFAPFAVSSGSGSRGGDRSEAGIAAGNNAISVNIFSEAANSRWLAEVKTVLLDPETFADQTLIRSELWRVSKYEMDTEKILLRLSSPLDAAREQVPSRFLSTKLVGALPSSSTLVVS